MSEENTKFRHFLYRLNDILEFWSSSSSSSSSNCSNRSIALRAALLELYSIRSCAKNVLETQKGDCLGGDEESPSNKRAKLVLSGVLEDEECDIDCRTAYKHLYASIPSDFGADLKISPHCTPFRSKRGTITVDYDERSALHGISASAALVPAQSSGEPQPPPRRFWDWVCEDRFPTDFISRAPLELLDLIPVSSNTPIYQSDLGRPQTSHISSGKDVHDELGYMFENDTEHCTCNNVSGGGCCKDYSCSCCGGHTPGTALQELMDASDHSFSLDANNALYMRLLSSLVLPSLLQHKDGDERHNANTSSSPPPQNADRITESLPDDPHFKWDVWTHLRRSGTLAGNSPGKGKELSSTSLSKRTISVLQKAGLLYDDDEAETRDWKEVEEMIVRGATGDSELCVELRKRQRDLQKLGISLNCSLGSLRLEVQSMMDAEAVRKKGVDAARVVESKWEKTCLRKRRMINN